MIGQQNNDIIMMSADLNTTIKTLSGHTAAVRALSILPDGRIASGSADTTVRVWNLTTGNADFTLNGHTGYVKSMDVLASGYLISVGYDSKICIWNTTSGNLVSNIANAHSGYIYAVKTINQYYFSTGGGDKLIKVHNSI